MTLEALEGRSYGPIPHRLSQAKVGEYVAATGDDAERWQQSAPPSYAGALLFVAAPYLLEDDDVRGFRKMLVHVDQRFAWHGPLSIGATTTIMGRVAKVRHRRGRFLVTFESDVVDADSRPLLSAAATFLMGAGAPEVGALETAEPLMSERGTNGTAVPPVSLEAGQELPVLEKSVSRLDLVRYAAASGDFNPVHFDHVSAVGAGLPGVVAHGLLMGAWICQAAVAATTRPDPLAQLRLRFRNPLLPARQARIGGEVRRSAPAEADMRFAVTAEGVELVTASALVRLDES